MIGFAVLFGLLAVFLAQTWLNNQEAARMRSLEAQHKAPAPERTIVVAARPLRFGEQLTASALRELPWPQDALPAGAFGKIADLVAAKRVVLMPMEPNEAVLASKVTGPGERATLSAVLDPGMTAVTVRVNDVEGVAGFVLPGDHVDVMLTRQGEKNSAATDVVIENAQVLAIDQLADEKADKPSVVKAVTLEVKATDGEQNRARLHGRHAVAAAAQGRRRRRAGFAPRDHRRSRQVDDGKIGFRDGRGVAAVEERARRVQRSGRARQCAFRGGVAAGAGAGKRLIGDDAAGRREIGVWGQVSGGEADVKSQYKKQNDLAGGSRRHADRTTDGAGVKIAALMRRGWIRAVLAGSVMAVLPPAVRAQESIVLANPVHSAQVSVTVGKTEDIRTDQNFANITVGDPDIADVSPLTDHSLSILGKKIGTTRVTVYDADHKPVGIFDVEVSYDISRLAAEIGHFTGGGIKVSSINGRILLSGTSPDAATLDKAVQIAGQFGPDPINTVQVMQPQQIELEVRFIEVDRNAGRDLGVQWNAFGNSVLANIRQHQTAGFAAADHPAGRLVSAARDRRRRRQRHGEALPISPVVAAGVLSGAAPFGFLVGQLTNKLQIEVNALESKGAARLLAEPNLVTLSGETASFLAGGQIPIPEVGATGTPSFGFQPYGVGLSFTPTVLRDGVINLIVKPEVSEIDHGATP